MLVTPRRALPFWRAVRVDEGRKTGENPRICAHVHPVPQSVREHVMRCVACVRGEDQCKPRVLRFSGKRE